MSTVITKLFFMKLIIKVIILLVTHEKCFICGQISDFTVPEGFTLLREAACSNCGSSVRNSDTARVATKVTLESEIPLVKANNRLKRFKILEAAASGPIHNALKNLAGYTAFEFFDDIPCGDYKDGVLCNDLQNLTFENNSFDLIITQDVLEHVEDPLKAFKEIKRVLKDDGLHVFTVPLHEGRLTLSRNGLPAVYHGDPIRKEGAIVCTDWGDDITSMVETIGMKTKRFNLHRFHEISDITDVDKNYSEYLTTPPNKYYRYNSIVFASKKKVQSFSIQWFLRKLFGREI